MSLLHSTVARMGGLARSRAKTLANRAKMRGYWRAVRAGELPPPRRPKSPPSVEIIAAAARRLCPRYGVTKLELFGSVARGEARRGSDIDLIATFHTTPGLRLIEFQHALEKALGLAADIMDAAAFDQMNNPYRRRSISADRRVIYES